MRFSIEAEQSVIGGLLQCPDRLEDVQELVSSSDFYNANHRMMYEAIESLADSNEPVDTVTLIERLLADGNLDQVGGADHIVELVTNTAGAANIKSYARVVADRAMERRIADAGQRLYEIAEEGGHDVDDKLTMVHSELASLERYDAASEIHDFDALLKSEVQDIDGRFRKTGKPGLKIGFRDLDERFGGIEDTDLMILAARPGMGKAQPLTSKVLMADGRFKSMGDVRLGDQLASVDGMKSEVTGVFPQGVRPIYRVVLSDGRSVECDKDHLWAVESCKFNGRKVISTSEIEEMISRERYCNRVRLASHDGSFGGSISKRIDPWLLGFLIGDGSLNGGSVMFSTGEPWIVDKVKSRLPFGCSVNRVDKFNYRIIGTDRVNPILEAVRDLGVNCLSFEKRVPGEYLSSDKETRQEVLLGLIESDGWSQNMSLQFSTASEGLAQDIRALTHSIGGQATVRRKSNVSYVANGERFPARDAFVCSLCFDGMTTIIKSDRVKANLGPGRRRSVQPTIRSIDYVRDDFAQCIKVSHPESLYITDGYVVTHNTTLALNIADNVTAQGKEVLIFSCEMSKEQLTKRLVAAASGVGYGQLRSGDLKEQDWPNLSAGVAKLKGRKIHIVDTPAIDVKRALAITRKFARSGNLGLVMFDYLQLLTCKSESRFDEVSQVSRQLKVIAKTVKAPVIALSQLSRKCEERPNKRPQNSDLRESGQIEQDADIITFMYRDEVYNEKTQDKGICEVITTKFRNGEAGTDALASQLEFSRFRDLDQRYCGPTEPEEKPKKSLYGKQ